jgi:hypothetical protein
MTCVETFDDCSSGTDTALENITAIQGSQALTPERDVASPIFQSTEETQRTTSLFDGASQRGVRLSFPDTMQRGVSTSSGSKRYATFLDWRSITLSRIPVDAKAKRGFKRVDTPEKKRAKHCARVVAQELKAGNLSSEAITNLLKEPCCGFSCNTDFSYSAFKAALMARPGGLMMQAFAIRMVQQCRMTSYSVVQDDVHPRDGYFIGIVSVCKVFFARAYGFSTRTLDRARQNLEEAEMEDLDAGDGAGVLEVRKASGAFSFSGRPKADLAAAWIHHYASIAGDRLPNAEDGGRQVIRVPHYDVTQVTSETERNRFLQFTMLPPTLCPR